MVVKTTVSQAARRATSDPAGPSASAEKRDRRGQHAERVARADQDHAPTHGIRGPAHDEERPDHGEGDAQDAQPDERRVPEPEGADHRHRVEASERDRADRAGDRQEQPDVANGRAR